MALCATLCGADGWDDYADFVRVKAKWFKTFLEMRHGAPSADTFRRVFTRLDPEAFERCFLRWTSAVAELSQGQLLAIDGKSIRRSFEHAWDKIGMTHMVSAFVEHNGQVLTQCKTHGKGGELEAIRELLGLIDLNGATVTIDALGAQKDIAQQIVTSGGNYILAVKDNQPTLHKAIRVELDDMIRDQFRDVPHEHHQQVDAGHGRIETRRVWVTDQLDWLAQAKDWVGLRSLVVVEAERQVPAHGRSVERRYFISSLPADAESQARLIRGHWGIENRLHHVLDVSFREDDSRIRRGNAPENVARIRRIALNLLRVHGDRHTKRKSIRGRRKIAGWDHDFLLKMVTG
jgi:predicted transposase YbfD/YdcC